MENIDLFSILIVGALVSVFQQWIKGKTWSTLAKKLLVIFISLSASGIYILFKDSAFWPTFIAILGAASTLYALLIKDLLPKE